jgi:hypothetical protein
MSTPRSPLWPVHPKPLVGEALSSWLLRIADGNGLDQRSFKRYLPKAHGKSSDLDLIDDDAFFTAMAIWSAIPREHIAALGFAQDEGRVFIRNTTGHPDWIIPRDRLGRWPEKRHVASQPYCPACLASDVTPYYRKVWRYAFHPICPKHGLLADNCPHCGHPFSYLALGNASWNPYGAYALKHCTACGTPFAKQRPGTFNALELRALATQSVLTEGLAAGWILHGDKSIPIAIFLRGLHIVAGALLNPEHGKAMCAWVAGQHPEFAYPDDRGLVKGPLERQTSVVRAWLLVFAFWLVQDWPRHWIALVRETGIRGSGYLPHLKSLPRWMCSEEIEQLCIRKNVRSPEETASAKKLLAKLRKWPANNAELTTFMDTGFVPPIKPRSRPISPEVRQVFNRQIQAKTDAVESALKREGDHEQSVRELYPPAQVDDRLSELLDDMDDTETSLPTLKRRQRSRRGKS